METSRTYSKEEFSKEVLDDSLLIPEVGEPPQVYPRVGYSIKNTLDTSKAYSAVFLEKIIWDAALEIVDMNEPSDFKKFIDYCCYYHIHIQIGVGMYQKSPKDNTFSDMVIFAKDAEEGQPEVIWIPGYEKLLIAQPFAPDEPVREISFTAYEEHKLFAVARVLRKVFVDDLINIT